MDKVLRTLADYFIDRSIKNVHKNHKIYLPLATQKLKWPNKLSKENLYEIARQSSQINARIEEDSAVLDIGSHSGFYGLNIARQMPNTMVIGIEPDKNMAKIALRVAELENILNFTNFSQGLSPQNIGSLPRVKVVLNLSVFHQWVRSFGLLEAKNMLVQIWERTESTMFFSMADTLGSPKNLQHLPDMGNSRESCKAWILENVLNLEGARVTLIDEIGTSYESMHSRFLFVINRLP